MVLVDHDGAGEFLHRVPQSGVAERISDLAAELNSKRIGDWAWDHYKDTVKGLIDILDAKQVMEIGGGRWPLLTNDEIQAAGINYIVNDISEKELSLAPSDVQKACFNISDSNIDKYQDLFGKVDVMFSKMVFEHVNDVHQGYRNIYKLLSPNGVCLNFHPVLYSPAFIVNWLLPEAVSGTLLRMVFPNRNDQEVPKHPAKYDHCVIDRREQDALQAIGFRKVWQIPFWYHHYFDKIPGLYHLDLALAKMSDRKNWTKLASYSFTLVMK